MSGPGDQLELPRLKTGMPHLDAIFHGGLPTGAITVIAGPPGSGKTILTQQLCFHHAAQGGRVLYFNTLSIPTAKTLLFLRPFAFFNPALIDERIRFMDLGVLLRTKGLEVTANLLMEQVKQFKPSMVVIDSFKVFDDLADSSEELRKFTYELSVRLMAWECTTFLLGEYNPGHFEHPTYSAIDGIITLKQREMSGEQQRLLQVIKMRGTPHSRDEHPFIITTAGVDVYAPGITLRRKRHTGQGPQGVERLKTGVSKLDELLGEGIPLGSSVILAGVAGAGKTMTSLEFLYRGARDQGEKGLYVTFEETDERLRATARGVGWDLERELDRGRVKFVFIPQPDILVDRDILRIQQEVESFGARRVVIDSISVFLHKIGDARIVRDKVFLLANIVQNQNAVGFFINDTPPGTSQVTRFGVEETVVDGVISLKWESEGFERHRYIEVVKLRNTGHAKGLHSMAIGPGGVTIYPRIDEVPSLEPLAPRPNRQRRVSTGVPRLDELLGGGLMDGSVTMVSGSPGTGKSTLALHFVLAAARAKERALFISLEEGPDQLVEDAEKLGLPLGKAVKAGQVEILYLPRAQMHATRFLSQVKDRLHEFQPDRVVLDSASDIEILGVVSQELRLLLYSLVVRLRSMQVTSLFTLEARSLFLSDVISERGLSPLADNIFMLRYVQEAGLLTPLLTVVKTRGSALERATHRVTISEGGLRLGERYEGEPSAVGDEPKKKRRRGLLGKRRK